MRFYCRSLLSLFVILLTLEMNAPVWAKQDIFMNEKPQYLFSPNAEINLQINENFFRLQNQETQNFDNSLVVGEVLAGAVFSLILSPFIMGIYVLGYDSDSSLKGPTGILAASSFNAFSLASAITLAGNIGRERGDFWETWGAAMIGNTVSALLILAVKVPIGERKVINELTTGLLISAAFLIPISCAVLGFNLSAGRKQATEILERTQVDNSGVSYLVLSF